MKKAMTTIGMLALISGSAMAEISVSNYDDLDEAFYGESFTYNGVTYSDVNNVAGVFPGGDTFDASGINGLGNTVIVENAAFLYNDFPTWGSGDNALTFGTSFVPGDNLSIGALSTVTMTLDSVSDFASVEMAFYENGPWGGIVYHMDAMMGGQVVGTDSFTISDFGGRDNLAFDSLSVDGVEFDSLRIYGTFGTENSGGRVLLDNLTLNSVPAPGSMAMIMGTMGMMARRRR